MRQGFDGSDEGLDGRIRDAKWLAFHYAAGETLGEERHTATPTY